MLNFLQPYILWIKIAAIAAIVGLVIFLWNSFVDSQQKIGYDKAVAEYTEKLAEEKSNALKIEREWTRKWQIATEERSNAENQIILARKSAVDSEHRLRLATEIFNKRIFEVTSETCRNAALSVAALFGECVTRYRDLAEKADRHVADERLCYSSWPE